MPYRKQVHRQVDKDGFFNRDIISRWEEPIPESQPLLIPIIQQGNLVYNFPTIEQIREYCRQQRNTLPKPYRLLVDAPIYPVKLSPQLEEANTKVQSSF